MSALLPCPFCGGTPKLHQQGNDYTSKRKLTIKCPDCRVQLTNGAIRNDMAWLERITIEAWNTRTQPP
ncbi:Lar family restriction alleviation protein, partial [Serratia liquefaciens]|uniref:Lar family restriction alleviation protein n=1 Tax=Serratia liquefaciens TaxID=614 RepID=UPI00235FD0DB